MSLKRMKPVSKDAPKKKALPPKPGEEKNTGNDSDNRRMLIMMVLAAILLIAIFISAIVLLVCHVKQEFHRPSANPLRYGRSMITMKAEEPSPPCGVQTGAAGPKCQ
ncbi:MAG: hypothetical protein IKO68_04730 [Oscillospiraceae bacterium]|nr:hypothetical protein [Oscillospiraceae bacterium]